MVLVTAACAARIGASTLLLGSYANPTAIGGAGVLTLAEGGQYTQIAGAPSSAPIEGTWKVTDDQIQFKETSGSDCTGVQGTYKWALEGEALSLNLVQDSCSPREADFTSGPWTRQP